MKSKKGTPKQEYISSITKLCKATNDIVLLDFILKLLQKTAAEVRQ